MLIDDFALQGYDVSGFGTTLVLHLQRDSSDIDGEQLEVCFSEVALYNFTHTAGAIITSIEECTVAQLLNEVGSRVVEWSHSYGIAQWNNSLGGYRNALETQEYKAWRIESSIGFQGFVIAKAMAASQPRRSGVLLARDEPGGMKTIGLIGGMSWESTALYYRLINEAVRDRLGGLHSARIVLFSVDFHDIERLQQEGDWRTAAEMLAAAARALQAAGADFLVLCTNTMHKVADAIEASVAIPLLHIADPTATAIRRAGHATVGLLGTRFTMEESFYRHRLVEHHGLDVIVPEAQEREAVHRIIYTELCQGVIRPESREVYRRIIADLVARGAEAVILGCTEISLLVSTEDSVAPLFDTTALHALAAAEEALRRVSIANPVTVNLSRDSPSTG